ncbi:hypothetical protein GQ600_22331 [Phytophthora cactorum]|nr:hypothetical protein GQ600_22331 [Phytophthora cactorum]
MVENSSDNCAGTCG